MRLICCESVILLRGLYPTGTHTYIHQGTRTRGEAQRGKAGRQGKRLERVPRSNKEGLPYAATMGRKQKGQFGEVIPKNPCPPEAGEGRPTPEFQLWPWKMGEEHKPNNDHQRQPGATNHCGSPGNLFCHLQSSLHPHRPHTHRQPFPLHRLPGRSASQPLTSSPDT